MIHLQLPLSREERAEIKAMYFSMVAGSTLAVERRVAAELPRILAALDAQNGGFRGQLSRGARSLFDVYVRLCIRTKRPRTLSHKTRAHIVAALQYLCEPLDVFPDYDLARGLLDDAYVINLCLATLKRSDKAAFEYVTARIAGKRHELS
jgi:uncharacterized membrane protein YkvA (DUF1232 family)